jgi:hypothetical protein
MATIITPRPPLNLFEVVRHNITDSWTTIYDVPDYLIPADGPTPERTVDAAAIMTGLLLVGDINNVRTVSIRVRDTNATLWPLVEGILVPAKDYIVMSLDRQVLLSGDQLQATVAEGGATVAAHFTFILNQREEYTVITP